MPKFAGRPGDLTWGRFDYPVTRAQKETLDAIWFLLEKLPRAERDYDLPFGGLSAQDPKTGSVYIGLFQNTINIHRNGRVTSNEKTVKYT